MSESPQNTGFCCQHLQTASALMLPLATACLHPMAGRSTGGPAWPRAPLSNVQAAGLPRRLQSMHLAMGAGNL